jgi:hypothetical protein
MRKRGKGPKSSMWSGYGELTIYMSKEDLPILSAVIQLIILLDPQLRSYRLRAENTTSGM